MTSPQPSPFPLRTPKVLPAPGADWRGPDGGLSGKGLHLNGPYEAVCKRQTGSPALLLPGAARPGDRSRNRKNGKCRDTAFKPGKGQIKKNFNGGWTWRNLILKTKQTEIVWKHPA